MKILSESPSRLSLFGGGTDIPTYYKSYGGLCINLAITLRQTMILYSSDDILEISNNRFPYNGKPDFIYEIFKEYGIDGGHLSRISSNFDGFTESGLGSSAAAAVCLISAINKQQNLNLTRTEIAEKAFQIEIERMKWSGGKQDQYASAYGGANFLIFGDTVDVIPFHSKNIRDLTASISLFYIGERGESSIRQRGFNIITKSQKENLDQVKKIAFEAINPMIKGDIEKIGYLLDKTWQFKKKTNKGISNPLIDEIYLFARSRGAYGGKICGAGGGGYMFFITDPAKKQSFIKDMKKKNLENTDFNIDFNGVNSRIL